MEAVARNIYQFFHVILVKAHDEPLWTRNSLERSIQWAKYCEKVMCEIFVINSILKDLVEEKEDNQPKCGGEIEMLTEKLFGLSGNALDMHLDLLARKSPETLLKLASCEDDRYRTLSCSTGLWIARRLAAGDNSVSASVWMQENGLLCKAACRSPSLMQCLLQRLQEHAETMEPCFTAGADEWVLTRNSPAIAWDWKRVAEVWTALKEMADGASSSSSVVTAFLKQAQRGSRGDFWDDLLFHCEPYRNRCHNTRKPVVFTPSVKSGS
ncbi:uncharacterized protein LOC142578915 isoform X4 [Dermacentor variabilis]|uniref:uncharacterized protein LOC142578915 isoform X4 n=1 Tax=Dermacentor variabilis TaxID=34621 RepID=UPI003F5B6797